MSKESESYLITLCKEYKLYFFILFFIAIFAAFFSIKLEYQIKDMIDLIHSGQTSGITKILIIFIVCKFLYHWMFWIRRAFDLYFKPKMLEKIMKDCYFIINKHSLHWFDSSFSGSIISKISDIQGNFLTVISSIFTLVRNLGVITFAFISLYIAHHYLFLYSFLLSITFAIIFFPLLKKQSAIQDIYTKNRQRTFGTLNDIISNVFLVRIISKIRREFDFKLKPDLDEFVLYEKKTRHFDLWVVDLVSTIFMTLFLCQTFLAFYLYTKNEITLGWFIFSIEMAFWISTETEAILEEIVENINPKIASLKASAEILNESLNFNDKENALTLQNVKGEIEFKDVNFGYNDHKNILENFSVSIKAGEKIGIVGPSGSGKTTFIKCLLRYFDVKSGGIFIDGNNIQDITQESLYENISIIPQDSSVFHRTILENLQIANYKASFEEIVEICKKVQIHDDIMNMKDQYQTIVGERGVKLSGGQRQRIAIARALLKNSPIVLLDEATSALDSPTEKLIQRAINEAFLSSKATMLIIAHRLSTITHCDRILVFESGKIVESGTHEELLAKNGLYKKLSDAQTYFY